VTTGRAKRPLSLLVAPLPGHSEEEVLRLLATAGATDVKTLAPGCISAVLPLDRLRGLEGVARVHLPAQTQPRSG
jgi:hypothetical protein